MRSARGDRAWKGAHNPRAAAPRFTNPPRHRANAPSATPAVWGHGRWVGDSFATISSTGANAAVIHYHAEHGACKPIDVNSLYLCDTGGQYVDGTTDTTRTLRSAPRTPS